jgi:hypothetical protein
VVCLADGSYGQSVRFPASGTSAAWITLTALNPLGATVTSVNINNQNYIEVDNLHVTGGSDLGIYTEGGHHTRVAGNLVENMPGGGINLNLGDYRTILRNTVRGRSAGTSGNTSAISIWEPAAFDSAPGYHNYIGYNTVYSNHDPVGGSDGNGIIYDDANGTQVSHAVYLGGVLMEENLAWDNGGSSIRVYQSQNALVRNNVAYWNGSFTSNSATYRGNSERKRQPQHFRQQHRDRQLLSECRQYRDLRMHQLRRYLGQQHYFRQRPGRRLPQRQRSNFGIG